MKVFVLVLFPVFLLADQTKDLFQKYINQYQTNFQAGFQSISKSKSVSKNDYCNVLTYQINALGLQKYKPKKEANGSYSIPYMVLFPLANNKKASVSLTAFKEKHKPMYLTINKADQGISIGIKDNKVFLSTDKSKCAFYFQQTDPLNIKTIAL